MRITTHSILILLGLTLLACDQQDSVTTTPEPPALPSTDWQIPPLLVAVSNNAVALVGDTDHYRIYSLLGLLSGKTWKDVTDRAFEYDSDRHRWQEIEPVPGGPGRLAASAQSVAGKVYVFGGYTVAEDGGEASWPGVYQYDPDQHRWSERSAMPLPVDDTVSAVYQDRYIYLVSGWHDSDNVDAVQIYDTRDDQWLEATAYPGPALFGHSGALVDNHLVICDGVKVVPRPGEGKRDFVISNQCFQGDIDPTDMTRIHWRQIPAHPGSPLYRAAAAGVDSLVILAGGSDNPYNYNGIGYDQRPSAPGKEVLAWSPSGSVWVVLPALAIPSMDHRGLLVVAGRGVLVGGLDSNQQVTPRVQIYEGLLGGRSNHLIAPLEPKH